MSNVVKLETKQTIEIQIAGINEAWKRTRTDYVAGVIETGQLLVAAQKQHGKSLREMAKELPFSWQTAHDLMAIASCSILVNHGLHGQQQQLPSSWRTLYELTKLPADVLKAALKDGRIHPNMERKEVAAMRAAIKEETKTTYRDQLLALFKNHPKGLTTNEAQALFPSIKPKTLRNYLGDLINDGLLTKKGKREDTDDQGRGPHDVYAIEADPKRQEKQRRDLLATAKAETAVKSLLAALQPLSKDDREHVIGNLLTRANLGKASKVDVNAIAETSAVLVKTMTEWPQKKKLPVILDIIEAAKCSVSHLYNLHLERAEARGLVMTIKNLF